MFNFKNTYATLPENFFQRISPTPVKVPQLVIFNTSLAKTLNIDLDSKSVSQKNLASVFSGNILPTGAAPLAMAYAGHQFGHFVPQLGDGRAILLGEIIDQQGQRRDLQLKGAGRTAYSRQGDGRAALGPMLREYVISEAMHALGIPTTRALAVVQTGETVAREDLLPGAILTRVAASHIRIGTFEYFAAQQDLASLKILADYVIERHYPAIKTDQNLYLALFKAIRDKQAALIAQWMRIGFIHGVMNTDNMAVSGETIDYGPCAFLDEYQSNKTFSSIDRYGRYAFDQQAVIALWNLYQLARALVLLCDPPSDEMPKEWQVALVDFEEIYQICYLKNMGQKIGLSHVYTEDSILLEKLLALMQQEKTDYTLTFQYLTHYADNTPWLFSDIFMPSTALQDWIKQWQQRWSVHHLSANAVAMTMRKTNPAFIPRNHHIEAMIQTVMNNHDFSKLHQLLKILSEPYAPIQQETKFYARAPTSDEQIRATFCGT